MIIPIDDKYRIAADVHSWMIQMYKGKNKEGKDVWQSVAWYRTIQATVQGLAERLIRTAEAETLAEALDAVDATVKRLTTALQPVVEVRRVS